MAGNGEKPIKLIRFSKLTERVGLKRGAIYERLNPASPRYDETFPKQIKIGANSVAWIEEEVEAWIDCKIEKSRGFKVV